MRLDTGQPRGDDDAAAGMSDGYDDDEMEGGAEGEESVDEGEDEGEDEGDDEVDDEVDDEGEDEVDDEGEDEVDDEGEDEGKDAGDDEGEDEDVKEVVDDAEGDDDEADGATGGAGDNEVRVIELTGMPVDERKALEKNTGQHGGGIYYTGKLMDKYIKLEDGAKQPADSMGNPGLADGNLNEDCSPEGEGATPKYGM
jgi:hypothetical protein